jgi:hypothetical protein
MNKALTLPTTAAARFAECNTRQRGSGKALHGKACFAEWQITGTRQRLYRVPCCHLSKIWRRRPTGHAVLIFYIYFLCWVQHSAKNFRFFKNSLPSATAQALAKACFFIFLKIFLCRVPKPWHSAKNFIFFKNLFAECQRPGTRQSLFFF